MGKRLTNFLTLRPSKEELVKNGILARGAEAFPELGVEFHQQGTSLPEKKRPSHLIGKNCMTFGCGKKVKGKKNLNCHRCGKIICKACMYSKKEIMEEYKYIQPVCICTNC